MILKAITLVAVAYTTVACSSGSHSTAPATPNTTTTAGTDVVATTSVSSDTSTATQAAAARGSLSLTGPTAITGLLTADSVTCSSPNFSVSGQVSGHSVQIHGTAVVASGGGTGEAVLTSDATGSYSGQGAIFMRNGGVSFAVTLSSAEGQVAVTGLVTCP